MKLKTKKPGCRHIKRQWQRKSNKLCQWLLDNSWICQLADWISRRLDISRTTQLMDPPAVAILVVITLIYGHKALHRSQHVLGAVSMLGYPCWFVVRIIMQLKLKLQVLLPAASTSCLVHDLSSLWDVQSASWESASCPVTMSVTSHDTVGKKNFKFQQLVIKVKLMSVMLAF